VSASTFGLLGIHPILGRDFRPEEDGPGAEPVVLLSHAIWQSRFAGDRGVLGRTVFLNGEAHTVVGVMPERFAFPEDARLWTPLRASPTAGRGDHSYEAVARLRPGVTLEQARSELAAIARELEARHPESNTGWTARVMTLREGELPSDVRAIILIMMGAVGFVLLIACANVANLLLARATERHREVAIRQALGAGRWRIVRQFLTESVIVALLGGALGVVLAKWGLALIVSQLPSFLPFWMVFPIDGPVLAFTLAVALGTGVLFGLAPALQAARPDLWRR
jgi:predicted permease